RLLTYSWRRARSRVRSKQWERRSSPPPRSRSVPSRISSGQAPTPFSLAAAAMRSFSTSTESRTYSTSAANGTSPNLISAALHVDRAGHPSVSSFFNTDDTKEEYNASEPVNDRKRWLEQFIHLMGHTGNYTREEAIAAIDKEGTLPDVLSFD